MAKDSPDAVHTIAPLSIETVTVAPVSESVPSAASEPVMPVAETGPAGTVPGGAGAGKTTAVSAPTDTSPVSAAPPVGATRPTVRSVPAR